MGIHGIDDHQPAGSPPLYGGDDIVEMSYFHRYVL
jgi:hypothetical protein